MKQVSSNSHFCDFCNFLLQVVSAQSLHAARQLPSVQLAGALQLSDSDGAGVVLPQGVSGLQLPSAELEPAPQQIPAELAKALELNVDATVEDLEAPSAATTAASDMDLLPSLPITAALSAGDVHAVGSLPDSRLPAVAANEALATASGAAQQAEEAQQAVAALAELPIAGGGAQSEAALEAQAACARRPLQGTEYNRVRLPDLHIEFDIRCVLPPLPFVALRPQSVASQPSRTVFRGLLNA